MFDFLITVGRKQENITENMHTEELRIQGGKVRNQEDCFDSVTLK